MSAMGDKSLEHSMLHHALNSAHRQAQHFGCLAGADVNFCVLLGFHWILSL
jgi:hypothetical protein